MAGQRLMDGKGTAMVGKCLLMPTLAMATPMVCLCVCVCVSECECVGVCVSECECVGVHVCTCACVCICQIVED